MSKHIDNLQKIKSWFVIHQEFEMAMDVKNAIDHMNKLETQLDGIEDKISAVKSEPRDSK